MSLHVTLYRRQQRSGRAERIQNHKAICPSYPSEEEKLAYFHHERGVEQSDLPGKNYGFGEDRLTVRRYFVEKFPLSISKESASSPCVVSFSYIDEGAIATPAFATFLADYYRLITSVAPCRIVFVTTKEHHVIEAERTFRHFFHAPPSCGEGRQGRIDNWNESKYPKIDSTISFNDGFGSCLAPEFVPCYLTFNYDFLDTVRSRIRDDGP